MNRRGFLGLLGAAIGGIALEHAIPLGRVWSFPKEVKAAPLALDGIPYFSVNANVGEWYLLGHQSLALQLEKVREQIPVMYAADRRLFELIEQPAAVGYDPAELRFPRLIA